MITAFSFLDLAFSEFRVDSSKQNTEPLPISWVLWLIFIRFQDSRKFQCQSHDHMKFLMCYLLSGFKKTARNSQNVTKESPPKASQTQKIVCPPPQNPPPGLCPGPTRGPKRPPWPLAQFEPPQHTTVWLRPWLSSKHCHCVKKYFYDIKLLHANVQCVYIVYAKYQMASVKTLVQVDFSVHALPKH